MQKLYSLLIIIVFVLVGCHSKSEKEYFDSADVNAKAKNYSEVVKEYDLLAKDYPKGDLTCKGLFESAKIYHSLLIPNLTKVESLKKAVEYYKRVSDEFEGKPEAEQSLFMIGFVQANELNQLDTAKSTYETFIKKYPNSQLINSVKLELNNLGKTPDEILQSQTVQK